MKRVLKKLARAYLIAFVALYIVAALGLLAAMAWLMPWAIKVPVMLVIAAVAAFLYLL